MSLSTRAPKKRIDGRWFLTGSHVALIAVSMVFFDLQRTHLQILFCFASVLVTELVFYSSTSKYKAGTWNDRAFSAIAEGAGLLVLLKSHIWWFYGLVGAMAVASKYIIRKDERSHVFNPTNFAIVMAITVFPLYWFDARADEFMVSTYALFHVTAFGIYAVWFGGTWVISISYILSILLLVALFYPMGTLADVIYAFGPEFGTIGLIFLWLMITDPKTAPKQRRFQILYAFMIALIHIALRKYQFLYSRYLALFLVTIGMQMIELVRSFLSARVLSSQLLKGELQARLPAIRIWNRDRI